MVFLDVDGRQLRLWHDARLVQEAGAVVDVDVTVVLWRRRWRPKLEQQTWFEVDADDIDVRRLKRSAIPPHRRRVHGETVGATLRLEWLVDIVRHQVIGSARVHCN